MLVTACPLACVLELKTTLVVSALVAFPEAIVFAAGAMVVVSVVAALPLPCAEACRTAAPVSVVTAAPDAIASQTSRMTVVRAVVALPELTEASAN